MPQPSVLRLDRRLRTGPARLLWFYLRMLAIDVFTGRSELHKYFLFVETAIALSPEVMDVAISYPNNAPPSLQDSYTKFGLVSIVWEFRIKSTELFPNVSTDEERKPAHFRKVDWALSLGVFHESLGVAVDLTVVPVVPAVHCCFHHLLCSCPTRARSGNRNFRVHRK